MNFNVRNEKLQVGKINVIAIGTTSMLKIGDTQSIQLSTAYTAPLTGKYLGSKFNLNLPGPFSVSGSGAGPIHAHAVPIGPIHVAHVAPVIHR